MLPYLSCEYSQYPVVVPRRVTRVMSAGNRRTVATNARRFLLRTSLLLIYAEYVGVWWMVGLHDILVWSARNKTHARGQKAPALCPLADVRDSPALRWLRWLRCADCLSRLGGDFDRQRTHSDTLLRAAIPLEFHGPIHKREESVVAANTDIHAGVELRAALTHDDRACAHDLAVIALDAKHLWLA